jgi:uncharacterized membrane protein
MIPCAGMHFVSTQSWTAWIFSIAIGRSLSTAHVGYLLNGSFEVSGLVAVMATNQPYRF